METTMSGAGKLAVFAVILAIFAAVGWYVGAPQSFHTAMGEPSMAVQPAAPAAAPAQPAQDSPAPPPPTSGEAAGH